MVLLYWYDDRPATSALSTFLSFSYNATETTKKLTDYLFPAHGSPAVSDCWTGPDDYLGAC